MPRWVKRTTYWVLGIALSLISFAWLVLAAPFFSDLRKSVVQNFLSAEIGQTLLIESDVRAVIARTTYLAVSDVVIPSEQIDNLNLAELGTLELDLDLLGLVRGDLNFDNIRIKDLRVNLVRQQDGTTSWSDQPDNTEVDAPEDVDVLDVENDIIAFLSDKNAAVSSIVLDVKNLRSGFEFHFDLKALSLQQKRNGAVVVVSSHGTINSHPFQIDGNYRRSDASLTSITMGDLTLRFEGHTIPKEQGGGYSGDLTLDTGEIGDLLDILKLERTLEGFGQLSAHLVRQGTGLAVQDLRSVLEFENGTEITLDGFADDLLASRDFDITVGGRLFPEGQQPPRATELSDLELTKFTANLLSKKGAMEIKEVLLETNYSKRDFREIGPTTVGQVRRTENGGLALENVLAQIGPHEAPFVLVRGEILDLLQFEKLDFQGSVNAPAKLLLPELQNDMDQAFGSLVADFEVSDSMGQLSLTKLEAYSENTKLWNLQANAAVRTVRSIDGVDFELNLDVPDTVAFLSALQLQKVDAGPLSLSVAVEGVDSGLETLVAIGTAQSRLQTNLRTTFDKDLRTTVHGSIQSERLNLEELGNVVEAGLQLASMGAASDGTEASSERKVQPLVLHIPKVEPKPEIETKRDDGRLVQKLVLDAKDRASQTDTVDVGPSGRIVQPLVLEDAPTDGDPKDLFDLERIGRDLDLEITIEIAEIVGQAGISKISSGIISKDGKVDLGPIEFGYGGGFFKLAAEVDFVEAPNVVRLYGGTSGWDIGAILHEVGAGIPARGKLRADFDLTGDNKSAQGFVDSMSGAVTISMVDGAIATSLLDLAGLGLFPWLFSKELQQGYTSIVCLVAPLRIDAGKVSSNAIVVETKSVQLVAAGSADWKNDRVAISAEPRPVGRPLARSAWPFEVTGRLSNPDFKIGGRSNQKNGKKARREEKGPIAARTPCKPDIQQ